ncbi:hypothetical protein FZEAL_9517 [Fusarium zealandicum]|uniref:CID domain-containing protein n=1 Tax=Fusarium zealandicum TaxID=1053134 RepID=A0A8H4UAS9_9HYPO|nr:hypothetical protein FZEAL_9517 [Fusarium zealandicum]
MSAGKGVSEFPNLEAKLQKPTKQSAFEKQKAEAEAKRLREAAETAAVYNEFVKSFDRDDDYDGHGALSSSAPARARPGFGGPPPPLGSGTGRRHFGTSGLKSGPGSLGPPPPSFGKKRSFQDFARAPREKGVLGFDEGAAGGSLPASRAFNTSDDEDMGGTGDREEEKAVAKPTLRLSNMPPGTSPAMIKALIPGNLVVENVKIAPPAGAGTLDRRHAVSIVTLSQDTPANEIEAAVNALQNRYLGYGFYLSLHRHLSSAVASSVALPSLASTSSASQPFGAKPVEQPSAPSNAPAQHGFHRGFAPPTSYAPPGAGVNRASLLHVPVKPPSDVRTIQLISKVIEGVLEHGPEFEALLMSRPEVQREEKWAWIWDARSQGGIWYRWRLWEVITGSQQSQKKGRYVPLFDGAHAWKAPEKNLSFEYTTRMDEFVSDSEYNSSDDEDFDDENKRENPDGDTDNTFLNPLDKAKLAHLLARLPTAMSRLRKGDVARVTTFAITHASRGVDEVVSMILSNIEKPIALTGANPDKKPETKETQPTAGQEETSLNEGPDISAASLVGLYVVSDILSSSSTSGVRHAWRFRQIFETALKDRKIFETLGLMAERLKWGRLRAEKWKRSISLVLNLWEGWCVFPAESQGSFVRSFENPPSSVTVDEEDPEEKKGKWKTVEVPQDGKERVLPVSTKEEDIPGEPIDEDDVIGEPVEEDDIEGEPIEEDDIEGEPIDEDDIEGEPLGEEDVVGEPMEEDDAVGKEALPAPPPEPPVTEQQPVKQEPPRVGGPPRKRMRAVDMFADSDDSDMGT